MGDVKAGDDIFFTRTMAEVLEKQGFYEDALMIYKIIADSRPGDPEMERKIQSLKETACRGKRKKAHF
ncbi:MAG: hypothetical protein BMS9Abin23_0665 [Thermodesulfobacteriota bacterium]|nr:MAG: hypothetical protein BMS9Abin23_0665 [Thermodesulfobacteriota bacterium]